MDPNRFLSCPIGHSFPLSLFTRILNLCIFVEHLSRSTSLHICDISILSTGIGQARRNFLTSSILAISRIYIYGHSAFKRLASDTDTVNGSRYRGRMFSVSVRQYYLKGLNEILCGLRWTVAFSLRLFSVFSRSLRTVVYHSITITSTVTLISAFAI